MLDQPADLAAGDAAADRDHGRSRGPRLGPVDRADPDAPLPQDLSSVRLARVAGLRRRRDGGHGLPRHGRGVHDLEARFPDERRQSEAFNFLPPAPGQGGFGQRVAYNDSYPPSSIIHLSFPARQHATGEAALGTTADSCRNAPRTSSRNGSCQSRAPSSSATRGRCGAKPTLKAPGSFRSRR